MSVLALISDLATQSQLGGAAARAGVELTIAPTEEALVAQAATLCPRLVIVDLSHPGIDPASLLARIATQPGAKLLAFGPHVHKAKLEAAASAGFNLVLSRGQFFAQMGELLATHATGDG